MTRKLLSGTVMICQLLAGQQPPASRPTPPVERRDASRPAQAPIHRVQSGTGVVAVDPKQPYRPIPANRVQPRETIFEFYRRALNPHQIRWGEEIDRRLAVLAEQSVGNPYFRLCAFQMGLILFLLMICWLWWDKMRQIKWVAAECLTDAINAKRIADTKALEAIGQYNRHIEMCNRVIEGNESEVGVGQSGAEARQALQDLQNQLAAARAEAARLDAELQKRKEMQTQLERRVNQLEAEVQRRAENPNGELVARLQRAEAELGNRKAQKK